MEEGLTHDVNGAGISPANDNGFDPGPEGGSAALVAKLADEVCKNDWRLFIADGELDLIVDEALEENDAPASIRPALVAEVLRRAAEPECDACDDKGVCEAGFGDRSWAEVCDCAAGRRLDDEDAAFISRRAQRASRLAYAASF